MKLPNRLAPASAVLFCAACALIQSPAERTHAIATEKGFRSVTMSDMRVRAFAKPAPRGGSRRVTIYVESDGAPWVAPDQPPQDPTPLKPLVLQMAGADPSNAVAYLGRPCQYLGAADLARCDPALWMKARFSEDAVTAMDQSVEQLKRFYSASEVNLVGYSGGGAMAALIAARRADVSCLVTLAAPLDTKAWTTAIGVSPLSLSLNPANFAEKLKNVRQTHFRGGKDRLVPPESTRGFLNRLPNASVIDKESFDHACCWGDDWQALLRASCLAQ
jgi:dienelactone hydrolase